VADLTIIRLLIQKYVIPEALPNLRSPIVLAGAGLSYSVLGGLLALWA
jgi:hypothetical protein